MKLLSVATFVALKLLVPVSADERALLPSGNFQQKDPCVLVQYEVQFKNGSSLSSWQCELSAADASVSGQYFVDIEGLGRNELNNTASGTTSLFVRGGSIANGKLTIPPGAEKAMAKVAKRGPDAPGGNLNITKRSLYLGRSDTRRVLAVRVAAADRAPGSTLAQIGNFVFGTAGDASNLRERYRSCSYGELLMEPYSGTTTTGRAVSGGVYGITLTNTANGQDTNNIVNAAVSQLTSLLGNLPNQFHHVMLCLPPGTIRGGSSTWVAYGILNNYLTVFNNDACNYPIVQVHEIGHNLNLQHSNEGTVEYDDRTCMMGNAPLSDTMRACFNAPKSAQLGWYSKRTLTLDFSRRGGFRGNLIGISDYQHPSSAGKYVYVKIPGTPFGKIDDIYVGFNRAAGINADVIEAQNMVTVHYMRPVSGGTSYTSNLVAKVGAGYRITFPNFSGTTGLIIIINSINLTASPPAANVDIYLDGCAPGVCGTACRTCCSASDCPIADPCALATCQSGSCVYDTRFCAGTPAVIGGVTVPTC